MALEAEVLAHAGRAGTDHAVVVTSDAHCGPLPEQLRVYCPKERLAEFDAFYEARSAMRAMMAANAQPREAILKTAFRNSLTEGGWDPHARLRDMDRDGVAGEVIFHGLNLGPVSPLPWGDLIGTGADPATPLELVGLGRRIYNRWLADFCSVEPERHAGLAHLPMWDPEAAVKELEWAAGAGLRGVNFPRVQPGIPPYNHPDWEPFWSACEDLVMPLSTHAQGTLTGSTQDTMTSNLQGSKIITNIDLTGPAARMALNHLIFGGVFDRHPTLRLVFTEQFGDWWAWTMQDLDGMTIGLRTFGGGSATTREGLLDLKRLPSEYCAEQLFIGATCLAPFEAQAAVDGGYATQVLWGSDYPHLEGTFQVGQTDDEYPMTKLALRDALCGVDRTSMALMAGENAARVHGLDVEKLRGVAARIGALTFDELTEPVEVDQLDPPHVRGAFYAFRRHSGFH